MKIYTKTGDDGKTSLLGGQRVAKNQLRLEAYGTVDELNSQLGFASAVCRELKSHTKGRHLAQEVEPKIQVLQHRLFHIGSHLACVDDKSRKHLPALSADWTIELENEIDAFEKDLPPLKQFILPGGGKTGAALHLARTLTRRVERIVFTLKEEEGDVSDEILPFLNRLSDYLFVLARYCNHHEGLEDITWVKS